MPPLAPIPGFIGPTYQAQSPTVDAERCVNWLLEKREAGNPKSPMWYYATPGLVSALVCPDGPHRASFSMDDRAWVVSGGGYYETTTGAAVLIGSVVNDGLPASICSNGPGGFQNFVVAGGKGYIHNLTTGAFAVIADVDFPANVGMGAFLDGYFLVTQRGTAKFFISNLEDGNAWDPLDVAQKSQTADLLLALIIDLDRKTVWLCGSQDTEIWWDAGTANFPFEPIPNALLSMGIVGAFAFAQPDNAIQWIGESSNGSRHAYEGQGVQSTKISNPAVEWAWSQYSTVDDCYTWTYEYRGHSISVFTFPTADASWAYDRTEQAWHEFLYWDVAAGKYRAHLGATHYYAFNAHYVGSRLDGTLYRLTADVFSDNGAAIRRMRRSPHLDASDCIVFCSELRFGFQVGVGLVSGQGSDPQVMFRVSRDGGRTYGNERWTSLGALGDYLRRVRFLRNGSWRDGVLEITISDPTVCALTECWGALSKGSA